MGKCIPYRIVSGLFLIPFGALVLAQCSSSESPTGETPVATNIPPVAVIEISPATAPVDSTFCFDSSGSSDAEDATGELEVRWDLDDDGIFEIEWSTVKECRKIFDAPGRYPVRLQVRDTAAAVADTTDTLVVAGASFAVTPGIGYLSTDFTFDASLSSDVSGSTADIECRWDFDSDGTWEITWESATVAHYQYPEIGSYDVTLEVRGSDLASTTAHGTVTVHCGTGILEWEFITADVAESHPALGADGTIYIGSWNGCVYAVNPDGTQKWEYATGGQVQTALAIGDDGTIYVTPGDGFLHALDPADGSRVWRASLPGLQARGPALAANGDIIASTKDSLFCCDGSGVRRWAVRLGSPNGIAPVIASDGTIYQKAGEGTLRAFSPEGALLWQQTVGDYRYHPAIGNDGTIYIGTRAGRLYALSTDGQVLWYYSTDGEIGSSPVIDADGHLYFAGAGGVLYALANTGTLLWSHLPEGGITTTPAIGANGYLYFGTGDNTVFALTPDRFRAWSWETGMEFMRTAPTIGTDGTIYICGYNARLFALRSSSGGLAPAEWPKYRGNVRNTGRR